MSKICAFFGHRDTPITSKLENLLEQTIRNLINEGVTEFWCCNEGTFDHLSKTVLLRLKQQIPYIQLCYVSAYNPDKFPRLKRQTIEKDFEIIYSPEIDNGPQKFAIIRRNKFISINADIFITYIQNNSGGAYNAIELAKKHSKSIIPLTYYN